MSEAVTLRDGNGDCPEETEELTDVCDDCPWDTGEALRDGTDERPWAPLRECSDE